MDRLCRMRLDCWRFWSRGWIVRIDGRVRIWRGGCWVLRPRLGLARIDRLGLSLHFLFVYLFVVVELWLERWMNE